jgi:hypothetical protein
VCHWTASKTLFQSSEKNDEGTSPRVILIFIVLITSPSSSPLLSPHSSALPNPLFSRRSHPPHMLGQTVFFPIVALCSKF